MCIGGGSPSTPDIPAPVEAPKAATPKDTTAATKSAVETQQNKAAAALGQQGSIVTSPFGVSGAASTRDNSLLGA